jgi:hypothetical protein
MRRLLSVLVVLLATQQQAQPQLLVLVLVLQVCLLLAAVLVALVEAAPKIHLTVAVQVAAHKTQVTQTFAQARRQCSPTTCKDSMAATVQAQTHKAQVVVVVRQQLATQQQQPQAAQVAQA